jgi:copper chaperone CopZ
LTVEYIFNVKDMTCGGCAASVQKAVGEVSGVQGIEIDVPSRRVAVATSADISPEAIVAAITAAGYTEIAQEA